MRKMEAAMKEMTVPELLSDQLVQQLMQVDGVNHAALTQLMESAERVRKRQLLVAERLASAANANGLADRPADPDRPQYDIDPSL